jgi:ubiquinone/menaquinone biosynthesis C-methylase UbiE
VVQRRSLGSFQVGIHQAAGIAECARVLQPRGTLVLVDLFARWLAVTGRGGRARTRALVEPLLGQANLRVAGWSVIYRIGPFPLVQAVVARR